MAKRSKLISIDETLSDVAVYIINDMKANGQTFADGSAPSFSGLIERLLKEWLKDE